MRIFPAAMAASAIHFNAKLCQAFAPPLAPTFTFTFNPLSTSTSTSTMTRTTSAIFSTASPSPSSPSSSPSPSQGSTATTKRRAKSIQDRTPQEAVSLLQDIVKAALDAGPRAGPARTLQAYRAISTTLRDFLPSPLRSSPAEPFSAPVALRKLFERLGATYVKLGQFVASSPTLFPKEYVTEFQKCLDQTEPLPWNVMQRVIESELGYPLSRAFSYVDKKPLASASIAQVHRATLRSTGDEVVIKIQKPQIGESLKADLSFLYVTSRVLEFLQPDWERTSLSAIAGDVRDSMLLELDFQQEARNVNEFRQFLVEQQLTEVAAAPRVYSEFTTKKILTMEYLDGVSLLDRDAVSAVTASDPERVIVAALNVWTRSVQTMPFFHADVHAGNLLVLRGGRVGFIDFGIVGRVSPRTFRAVEELSLALAGADPRGMARALSNMGATDRTVDIERFAADIESLMNKMARASVNVSVRAAQPADGDTLSAALSIDEEEITNMLLEIVQVTENNGLKLPREFGLLVKQSLYFDRYLKILAPGLDVLQDDRVRGVGGGSGTYNSANGEVAAAAIGPVNGGASDGEVVIDV